MSDILGDGISSLELIDAMPFNFDEPYNSSSILTNAEAAIVLAARTSTTRNLKSDDKDINLLKYLIKNKHTSPFEMVELKFEVTCPLVIARQWMRHRTFNINEQSRRYTSDDLNFYLNNIWLAQSESNKQGSTTLLDETTQVELTSNLIELVNIAVEFYEEALELGASREQARFFLPQNMYTTFVAKNDLKNLMDFCKSRTKTNAQYEMQLFALEVESHIKKAIPNVFDYWKSL